MSSALQKFNKRDQMARFSLESQKLSQYIQNLNENQYAQERWVWELVQNAKDVGNQFDKIIIKITIEDNRLVFTHNGYPFSPEQLNSIISQYSLKQEQNSEDVQTTGKYGTGFISTHILSRIIRVEGKLKVVPDDVSEMSVDSEEDQKISLEKKKVRKEEVKRKKAEAKELNKGYYQKFDIVLDRSYKSRDQLAKKLMKTKKEIEKQLGRNDNQQPIYARSQQDFDTSFIYENLDSTSFLIIQKGIQSLQKLFPSALLFNSRLYQVQVVNKSSHKHIGNFKITRQDNNMKINLLNTFSVHIESIQNQESKEIKESAKKLAKKIEKIEKIEKNRIISYAYLQDPESKSLIAVPIEITTTRMIKLLRFDHGHPKIYKEFPLIGSEDTFFNFIFTSREFYPNETRTQLLLKSIENRPSAKAEQNWKTLSAIFDNISDLYLLMHKYIISGKMNLFIMEKNNCFTQINQKKIKSKYLNLQKSVNDFAIFNTKKGKKSKLKDVCLIYQKFDRRINSDEHSQILLKMNQIFSFLHLDNTLQDDEYLQFIQYLHENKNQFKLISLHECLNQLQNYKFNDLKKLFGSTEACLDHLGKIYQFLTKNTFFRHYLYNNYCKIILTQDLLFQSYQYLEGIFPAHPKRLLIKKQYQSRLEYEAIAEYFGIKYKNGLIYQQFSKYFDKNANQTAQKDKKNQNYFFGLQEMISKFRQYFANITNMKMLQKLGTFLNTFQNPKPEAFSYAASVIQLQGAQIPIPISAKTSMNQKIFDSFAKNFTQFFLTLMFQKYESCDSLTTFMSYLSDSANKKLKAINIINFLLREGQNTISSKKLLSWNQSIVHNHAIANLTERHSYLTEEDIFIHEKFIAKYKTYGYLAKSLKESLVHPNLQIPEYLMKKINPNTFGQLFSFLNNFYNDQRSSQDRHQILNYFCKIYESYVKNNNKSLKNKYQAFKQIIDVRYLQYAKLLPTLTDDQKDLICKIFRMRQDFADLQQLLKQNLKEVKALLREKNRQEMAAEVTEKKRQQKTK